MSRDLMDAAATIADLLQSAGSRHLPPEVLGLSDDGRIAAVVVNVAGADYLLSIGLLPIQRQHPHPN